MKISVFLTLLQLAHSAKTVSQCFLSTFHRGISNSAPIFELWNVDAKDCLSYCIIKAAGNGDGCVSVVFHKKYSTCQLYGHDGTFGGAQLVYASDHDYYNRTSYRGFCGDRHKPLRGYQFERIQNKEEANRRNVATPEIKSDIKPQQAQSLDKNLAAVVSSQVRASPAKATSPLPTFKPQLGKPEIFVNQNCAYPTCAKNEVMGYFLINGYTTPKMSKADLHSVDQEACIIYCTYNLNKNGEMSSCLSTKYDEETKGCWLLGKEAKDQQCRTELYKSNQTTFVDKFCIPVVGDARNACPSEPLFKVYMGKQIVGSVIDYSLNIASLSHCVANCVNSNGCQSLTYKNGLCYLHNTSVKSNARNLLEGSEDSIVVENGCNKMSKQHIVIQSQWSEWGACTYSIGGEKVQVRSRDCGKASCTDLQAKLC